jgi:hypothetical protein
MSGSNFALSYHITGDAYGNGSLDRVDVDRRVSGMRDRKVACRAEERLDLDCRAAHAHPVENFSRPWDGDGREYAQDAERDGELDNREGMSHVSFRLVGWLDRI